MQDPMEVLEEISRKLDQADQYYRRADTASEPAAGQWRSAGDLAVQTARTAFGNLSPAYSALQRYKQIQERFKEYPTPS